MQSAFNLLTEESAETTPLLNQNKDDDPLAQLDVYATVHDVYEVIEGHIDRVITEEGLKMPALQVHYLDRVEDYLTEKYLNPSIVYVLLLCRLEFLRERDSFLASHSLQESRANICQILAIRMLRRIADQAGSNATLEMCRALVGGWHAFQGAPDEVLERVKANEGFFKSRHANEGGGKTNALELAILTRATTFIKSHATQKALDAIWEGRVTYSSSSFINMLPDTWKRQKITVYNIEKSPILNHYRLRVPKYRSKIDYFSFLVLFVSFLAVILKRQNQHEHLPVSKLTLHEKWFFLYALGFSLDKIASVTEHGFSIYAAGLTNGLDLMCIPIFAIAFGFRIKSIMSEDAWAGDQAFAVLSSAACLLFPRLAFAVISENVLILSLRAMLADFAFLLSIAVFCFLGFVFALNHLCDGDYSVAKIGEWLIFIWFGLDGSGIDASPDIHPILGPLLIIVYAALSNTLLVSLLVAILSGTYSKIAADSHAEDMFRRAVLTFEGVKADSLFDYVPPLNLIALLIMWPISWVTSPRWFHKINVATTRTLSLPILLWITIYERNSIPNSPLRKNLNAFRARIMTALPDAWGERLAILEGAHWACSAVFEYDPKGDDGDEENADENEALPKDEENQIDPEPEIGERPRLSSRASTGLGGRSGTGSRIVSSSSSVVSQSLTAQTGESSASTIQEQASAIPLPAPASPSTSTTTIRPEVRFDESPTPSPPSSPRKRRQSMKERLPPNAYGAIGIGRRQGSSEYNETSALSTSAPYSLDSPLMNRMLATGGYGDAIELGGAGGGRIRRMSLSAAPIRSNSVPELGGSRQDLALLLKMIGNLQKTVERLEKKVDWGADEGNPISIGSPEAL